MPTDWLECVWGQGHQLVEMIPPVMVMPMRTKQPSHKWFQWQISTRIFKFTKVVCCSTRSDYSFIGWSMDRVRTCKCHPPRREEIKCPPTTAKKPKGSFEELSFLQETNGQTTLLVNPNHPYFFQVQCYLALCGMVIWSPQETQQG